MYKRIENSSTSLAHTSVLIGSNNFKFGKRHVIWYNMPHQNSGQIDGNLRNHVFDDVVCKPPIA